MNSHHENLPINAIEKDLSKLDLPNYIDQPEYVTNKMAGYGLQIVGWFLWIWLFIPLLTFFLWWYQSSLINTHLFEQDLESHLHHFKWVAMVILTLMLMLIIWASSNWYCFYRREEHKKPKLTPIVDMQAQADFFEVNGVKLIKMKHQKIVTIHYDEHGKFIKAE